MTRETWHFNASYVSKNVRDAKIFPNPFPQMCRGVEEIKIASRQCESPLIGMK